MPLHAGTVRSRVVNGVRYGVSSQVNHQKDLMADGLAGLGHLFTQIGEELGGQGYLGNAARVAGSRLGDAADRIRERQPAELAHAVTRLARQHPAAFVAGAFVLGLAIAHAIDEGEDER